MAMDRTNMVSYLDTGLLNGGSVSALTEMGDGFTELEEDWGPNTESTQYVNMKNASNTVKGYEFSMEAEREYLSDEMQEAVDALFKDFPTGSKCETFYYRFYKTDIDSASQKGDCIKVPVTVCPSTTGGAGGDTLTSTLQINGNGDVIKGEIDLSGSTPVFTAS